MIDSHLMFQHKHQSLWNPTTTPLIFVIFDVSSSQISKLMPVLIGLRILFRRKKLFVQDCDVINKHLNIACDSSARLLRAQQALGAFSISVCFISLMIPSLQLLRWNKHKNHFRHSLAANRTGFLTMSRMIQLVFSCFRDWQLRGWTQNLPLHSGQPGEAPISNKIQKRRAEGDVQEFQKCKSRVCEESKWEIVMVERVAYG